MNSNQDSEMQKLQAKVARLRKEKAKAKAAEAAGLLRKACDLVTELDSDPDAIRAAEHIAAAADILVNFKPDEW